MNRISMTTCLIASQRTRVAALVLGLLALSVVPGKATEGAEAVDVKLFSFKPKVVEIEVGTTVEWINGDAIEHTVTLGTPDGPVAGFDSGFFTKGETFVHTFTEVGEFQYFCRRHESMHGVVRVVPKT